MAPIIERPELTNSTRVGEPSAWLVVRERSAMGKSMVYTGSMVDTGVAG